MSTPHVPRPRKPIEADQLDYLSNVELKLLVETSHSLFENSAGTEHFRGLARFYQELIAACAEILEERAGVELTDDERAMFDIIERSLDRA